jgi:hypothetical protein
MRRLILIVFLLFLVSAVASSGFSQLRMPSPYFQDRINLEGTYFVLNDGTTAGFGWASEWTQETAQTFDQITAIFLWHFKDGSVAYVKQGEYISDFGMLRSYLAKEEAPILKDGKGKPFQPMTLKNYPVKIELWIGTADENTGFTTKVLVDTVCFESDTVEYGQRYYFKSCNGVEVR